MSRDAARYEHDGVSKLTIFSLASNGLLLVLLVVAMLRKPRTDAI